MMEPVFYFDFGSPNAYLAHRVIPGIEQRTGCRFVYRPILLGGLFKLTGNQSPMTAFADIPAKLAYQRLEMERFVRRHGLTRFSMNPHFPVNTLAAMRGAVAADSLGILADYVEAVFCAMWEKGQKLDDPVVLAAAMVETDLPADRLMALAQDPAIKARLAANTEDAAAYGAFGAPSFLVGDALYFGKDRLCDVEREMMERGSGVGAIG